MRLNGNNLNFLRPQSNNLHVSRTTRAVLLVINLLFLIGLEYIQFEFALLNVNSTRISI